MKPNASKSNSSDSLHPPVTVVARRDGTVVDQNLRAKQVLGSGDGKRCWEVFRALPKAEDLPCTPGCVGELLDASLDQVKHTVVSSEGKKFDLTCVPIDETAVCILSPRATLKAHEWEKPTPREIEVLRLLADGKTTTQIATVLDLSNATVRTHVENLLQKFRVHTRTGLVALGFRLGYLD